MKYRKYLLAAAALVLIGISSIRPAVAYFTDSHQANGTATVYLGDLEITPNEEINEKEWVKRITVKNTGDYDVFVRVKAIYGSEYGISTYESTDNKWSYNEADNYYYYADMLAPGSESSVLKLTITPNENFEYDTFNVVIVEEAAKAQKVTDENGDTKIEAIWDEPIMNQSEYEAQFKDTTGANENSEGGTN